jgi:hypothetical protein
MWVAWRRRWAQPVLMIASLGSLLHFTSHLRDGGHSQKAVASDIFFALIAGLLLAALYACGNQDVNGNGEFISSKERRQ